MDKFDMQEKEYAFPYHYIPEICGDTVKKKKELRWACEFLAYTKFIASKVVDSHQDNCLDVGCGDGRLCNMIRSLDSDIHIKGIDVSDNAISWAKIFNPQVEFETKSITEIKDKWKIITCVETIEHIPDDELDGFFIGLSRALDDGGVIYIIVPSDNIPLAKKHYRHYNFFLLEEQLKKAECGLEIVEKEYIVPSVNWLYSFILHLSSNRYWDFHFFDKVLWKYLWKNGLIATSKNGSHCFAVLRHVSNET